MANGLPALAARLAVATAFWSPKSANSLICSAPTHDERRLGEVGQDRIAAGRDATEALARR
ncbi:MAG: hypothetical protein IPJ34_43345, partial [Myxococcales bacterium]|nr:hypothetical protein [Myxococcales bacterium]